jgi:hypothetical protein
MADTQDMVGAGTPPQTISDLPAFALLEIISFLYDDQDALRNIVYNVICKQEKALNEASKSDAKKSKDHEALDGSRDGKSSQSVDNAAPATSPPSASKSESNPVMQAATTAAAAAATVVAGAVILTGATAVSTSMEAGVAVGSGTSLPLDESSSASEKIADEAETTADSQVETPLAGKPEKADRSVVAHPDDVTSAEAEARNSTSPAEVKSLEELKLAMVSAGVGDTAQSVSDENEAKPPNKSDQEEAEHEASKSDAKKSKDPSESLASKEHVQNVEESSATTRTGTSAPSVRSARSTSSTPAGGASVASAASSVTSVAASSIVSEDVSEIRGNVLELLKKHHKGKVGQIDIIMERFKGKEYLLHAFHATSR